MKKFDDFLEHHGIGGMQWGKRRWQYKNGRLTPEGKIRYGKGDGESDSEKKDDAQEAPKKYRSDTDRYKDNDVRKLSDKELKERNNRLSAENNYLQYLKTNKELTDSRPRRAAIKKAAKKIFVDSAVNALSNVMQQKVYSTIFNNFVDNHIPQLAPKPQPQSQPQPQPKPKPKPKP